MDNFIYSMNITMPIFLVMVIGYVLKRQGMLNENFVTVANKLNFNVTLPVMLFRDISTVDIRANFDLKYVLYCAIVSSICFFSVWGLTKLFLKEKSMQGAFVQSSFRGSAAVMGLAFIDNMYGSSIMGPLMIVGAVPLYNIYSVMVLTVEGNDTDNKNTSMIKKTLVNIAKNPIIIAILLGVAVSLIGIDFPVIVDKTIENVARMATPLALVAMGAGFKGKEALAKLKPTLWSASIKLVWQVALFLPVAVYMGFREEKLIALLIMLGAPTTPSCYIMAKNMNNDGELTASVVVTTTLLAAFTLTGWIFILKSLGLV